MKKANNKNLEVITSSIFYFIVAVLCFYIFVEVFMPRNTVKIFGFKPYSVITRSMEPVIMDGDFIIVVNPKLSELNPDDETIITFLADFDNDGDKEVVTHYLASVDVNGETRTYQTNGYDKPIDSWVLTDDDILGVYLFKIPYLGKFVNFLKTPIGLIILSLNLVAIIIIKIKVDKAKANKELKVDNNDINS